MLTCMWEDGVHWGVKEITGETFLGNRRGVRLTRTVRRTTETKQSGDDLGGSVAQERG